MTLHWLTARCSYNTHTHNSAHNVCGSVGISKRHNRWGCLKPKKYEVYNKCIGNGVHGWMGVFRARSLVQRRTIRVGGPRRFSVSPGGRTFTSEIVHGGVLLWCTGGQWCGNHGQFASIQVRRAYHSYTGCNSYTDVLVYVCIVVLVYKYVPSVA